MSRLGKLYFSLTALLVLAAASTSARADTITISGVNSGQAATATIVCEFNSQTNTFTFTITNTSAITQPGSTSTITGIGYDLPPLGNASASGLNGFTGMQAPSLSSTFNFSDADLGNVPHGFNNAVLDFGFTTGASGNFNGGSVNEGLLPGESASFTVSGAAFTGFTETEICNAVFVRFQNVPLSAGSEGSDVGTPGGAGPIPEPSSILLLGSALVGLGGYARRRLKLRN
ncbi:MAG TPA: PEP-CTERM sorting domain-containing protein [Pyrinomonadaceae bacterium]|nr:PEP-CTERM sorting domain-containing protein [Pyrinomonadaceae bacterium]